MGYVIPNQPKPKENQTVEEIINELKAINVDGETMEHIVDSVYLSEQLLRQLFLKSDDKTIQNLLNEKNELKLYGKA